MEWKEHPTIIGYWANENGEIAKIDPESLFPEYTIKIVKQSVSKKGYLVFSCGRKVKSSHRFIYECFNGLIPETYVIDHLNTIRTDNRIENLKACSVWDNNHNKITVDKLRSKEGHYVLVRDKKNGKIVNWFPSLSACGRFYDTDKHHISRLISHPYKNKRYKDYGCTFERTENKYTQKWGEWWITN